MTKTLTSRKIERIETLDRSFALRDAKYREIGGQFYITREIFTALPAGSTSGYTAAPGERIVGRPQATRDGKPYGASQRDKEFPSIEAARAAAYDYFNRAAARAGHR